MNYPTLSAALLGALAASAAPLWADDEVVAWRLFVADQSAPTIKAIDLDHPEQRWTFDVAGPAKLYSTPSKALVVAVQSDHERVDFLHSGLTFDNHGDHVDIDIADPSAIGHISGPRPFHVVNHGGDVAIAFDKGGYGAILAEGAILNGALTETKAPMNVAHHGFVAPMGDHFVSSVASEEPVAEGKAPPRVGIGSFAADGSPIGEMQICTDLHGEAFSGSYLLAGCKEGIAALDTSQGADAYAMLPYPADLPEGHTGTLLGSPAMQIFLGNYGADGVVIIDPAAEPHFTYVQLPFRRVDFILDPAKPQMAYIFTEDGTLHRLNMLSAQIEKSAQITQPYSMDGHWRDPRPRLAMAGERLILTDPLAQTLRVIDTADLSEQGTIALEGIPYNVVALGGSGLSH
ncbi:metallochaperone AztD [Pseudorhodobacter aquimaris]|uniref:metallochaperone AztD n=1 Tax=Pseudorhodobacter aquimaris TaxID=687412 RepID=UPI00067C2F9A|nr:metallochaperone AztD [Pseudorhodobacter aquimaris]